MALHSVDLLYTAITHQKSGRFDQAEALYRQVLRDDPRNSDALHLLGVIAIQKGDLANGAELISKAIGLIPTVALYHSNRGLAKAMLGHTEEAIRDFREAIRLGQNDAETQVKLGNALHQGGRSSDAILAYQAALTLSPASVDAHTALGIAFMEIERVSDASRHFKHASELAPSDPHVQKNLANALARENKAQEAVRVCERAVELAPANPEFLVNLGYLKLAAGDYAQSLAAFERAIVLSPNRIEALLGRARALFAAGNHAGSDKRFLELDRFVASNPELSYRLAVTHVAIGNVAAARRAFDHGLSHPTTSTKAKWNAANLLPRIYRTPQELEEWRSAFPENMRRFSDELKLETSEDVARAIEALGTKSNFEFFYQGHADRDSQVLYANILHRIAAARFPSFIQPIDASSRRHRVRPRVGFVSEFLHYHTIYKIQSAWITDIGKDVETYAYYLGQKRDEAVDRISASVDQFRRVKTSEQLVEAISADELDVLIYLDIGMSPRLQLAIALWLAPVQCNGLGHPVTTGLRTINYALSSELMEPKDGDTHYTETLVRLPNTAYCYDWSRIAGQLEKLESVKVESGKVRYLCAQFLPKYLPQFDHIFSDIATEVPNAEFHFIADGSEYATTIFRDRLKNAFAKSGLDAETHCRFHPHMDQASYLALNLNCDIFLDCPLWSGNNTTHEAIACGMPIVTWPGPTMRSRHAYALLARIGVSETIAADLPEFVAVAARAGRDKEWRKHLRAEIERRRHVLYDDPAPVLALGKFVLDTSGGQAPAGTSS